MKPTAVVFYGKGGTGKSLVASHVSAAWARQGLRVLHLGCDPKGDSTLRLRGLENGRSLSDFMDDNTLPGRRPEEVIVRGRWGIDTVETGGPPPGRGCAGRTVSTLVEFLGVHRVLSRGYERVVFDVLGDLVCGGFVAPLWPGFADRVVIVASGDPMSLFAANNIARTVQAHARDGVRLTGIVFNVRNEGREHRPALQEFAARINARALAWLEWDPLVRETERKGCTLFEEHPDAPTAAALAGLAKDLEGDPGTEPTPLSRQDMLLLARTLDA